MGEYVSFSFPSSLGNFSYLLLFIRPVGYLQTESDNLDDPQSAPFITAQLNTN
jgi:hypothetical protein